MKWTAVVLVIVAVILLAVAGMGLSRRPEPVSQPIAFDHQLHVEELGFECTDCHVYAQTGVRATIPNVDACGDCHDEMLTESPAEARLVEYVEAGEPIPWRKIYWVPEGVYFSHRRHATLADIECETCHGEMRSRSQPVVEREVPITMESCMECHEAAGASNDCLLCHY